MFCMFKGGWGGEYVSTAEKSCLQHLHASWSGIRCRWGDSLLAVRGLTKRLTPRVCRPLQSLSEGQQWGWEVSGRGLTGQIPTAGIQQLHLSGGPPASLRDQIFWLNVQHTPTSTDQ